MIGRLAWPAENPQQMVTAQREATAKVQPGCRARGWGRHLLLREEQARHGDEAGARAVRAVGTGETRTA